MRFFSAPEMLKMKIFNRAVRVLKKQAYQQRGRAAACRRSAPRSTSPRSVPGKPVGGQNVTRNGTRPLCLTILLVTENLKTSKPVVGAFPFEGPRGLEVKTEARVLGTRQAAAAAAAAAAAVEAPASRLFEWRCRMP